jgi:hypothetical protein
MYLLFPLTFLVSAYSTSMNESSSEGKMPMRHGFADYHLIPVILTITMLTLSQTLGLGDRQKYLH